MRLSFGLKASLSASMVALALLVSALAGIVYTGLAVHGTVRLAGERAMSVAQQAALLAGRAAAATPEDPSGAVRQDRALRSLFESALAGDPTLLDVGVYDTSGEVLAHSQPDRLGQREPRRASWAALEAGGVAAQATRLLEAVRVYEIVVPLGTGAQALGEVRVGVSSALLRDQLLEILSAGAWVVAAAVLIAVLVAIAFAQLLTKRVRTVMAGLERLREGEFGHRLAVEGRDELALLASSINALGERLEATRQRAAAGEADPEELLQATGQISAWAKVASGLAHELADPMNAAALHLGHLKRKWKNVDPEVGRHLRVLEDELKRLEHIVLGFRRFSMLGEMRAEWFDLRKLLDEVVERARETAGGRRIELRVDRDGVPQRFWGDPSLLRQALSNLVANACQAMPGGGQVVLAGRRAGEAVEIAVSDEGVGIPEDVQPRIFDLYFTTKQDGSGIGLAVVQKVVQLHGGQIRLRSAPGQGTEVTLQLPLRERETVHAA